MEEVYKSRKEFDFLFTSKSPNIAVVASRNTGKTVAAAQMTVHRLLSGSFGSTAVIFSSSLRQARNTVGNSIDMIIKDYPEGFASFNGSNFTYSFRVSNTDIRKIFLLSYDMDTKKLRGYHPETLVLDECASMPYNLLGLVIEPMMSSDTRLLAIGTAEGPNRFYELWLRGQDVEYPDWESYTIKACNCGFFDKDLLWRMQNSLTTAEYAQEYECDFNANVFVGSVYGEFMRRFTDKNIDDCYTWDSSLPVWTAWDLGISDYTSIWFFQVKGDTVTFIDYFEDNGQNIEYYAQVLLRKPYMYRSAILPHDGGARNIRGAPVAEQLNKYSIRTEVLGLTSEQEGINAVRTLLQTARFNKTNCELGIKHLRNFKYKIDKKTGLKLKQTEHDEHSHGADAFRYAVLSRDIWKAKLVDLNKREHSGSVANDYSVFV